MAKKNSWAGNFGRSVMFSAKEIAKNKFPSVTNFGDSISDVAEESTEFWNEVKGRGRDPKTIFGKLFRDTEEGERFGEALSDNNFFETFKNFVKTGNTSLGEEESSKKMMKSMGFDESDFDFGEDDLGLDDLAKDLADDVSGDVKATSKQNAKIASEEIKAINAGAEATVKVGTANANAIANVNRSLNAQTQALVASNERSNQLNANIAVSNAALMNSLTERTVGGLTAINTNLANLVSFNQDTMIRYTDAAFKYYDASVNELQKINETLLRAFPEKKQEERKETTWENLGLGGYNSSINLTEYAKHVRNNIGDSPLGMFFDPMVISGLLNDPISQGLEMILENAIPTVLDQTMKKVDDSIANFFPALIGKITQYGNDNENTFLGSLAKIFGVDLGSTKKDIGNYEKGPVPFDGITHRTINLVIPRYLSEIVGLLGGQRTLYDHSTGKFKTPKQMKKDQKYNIDSAAEDAVGYDTIAALEEGFDNIIDTSDGGKKRDKDAKKLLRPFLTKMVQSNKNFIDMDDLKDVIPEMRGNDDYEYLIDKIKMVFPTLDTALKERFHASSYHFRDNMHRKNNSSQTGDYLQEYLNDNFYGELKNANLQLPDAERRELDRLLKERDRSTDSNWVRNNSDSYKRILELQKLQRDYEEGRIGYTENDIINETAHSSFVDNILDRGISITNDLLRNSIDKLSSIELNTRALFNAFNSTDVSLPVSSTSGGATANTDTSTSTQDNGGPVTSEESRKNDDNSTYNEKEKEGKYEVDGRDDIEDDEEGHQQDYLEHINTTIREALEEQREAIEDDESKTFFNRIAQMVRSPLMIFDNALQSLDKTMYNVFFGKKDDGVRGIITTIQDNFKELFDGMIDTLRNEFLNPFMKFIREDIVQGNIRDWVNGGVQKVHDWFNSDWDASDEDDADKPAEVKPIEPADQIDGINNPIHNAFGYIGDRLRGLFPHYAKGHLTDNQRKEKVDKTLDKKTKPIENFDTSSFAKNGVTIKRTGLYTVNSKPQYLSAGEIVLPDGSIVPNSGLGNQIANAEAENRAEANDIKEASEAVKNKAKDAVTNIGKKKVNSIKENILGLLGDFKDAVSEHLFGENKDENGKQKPLKDQVTDMFATGMKNFNKFFFGETMYEAKESKEEYNKAFKQSLPKGVARGLVAGAGLGLVSMAGPLGGFGLLGSLFLPGGIVGSAILGLSVGMLSENRKFMNWMFGEKDPNGDRTGGIVSKGVQDFFKKNRTAILGGGAVGLAQGISGVSIVGSLLSLLPGGAAVGVLPAMGVGLFGPVTVSIAAALALKSEAVQKQLFGTDDGNGKKVGGLMQNKAVQALKGKLPNIVTGAAIGGIGSLAIGQMGILGGLVVGPYAGAILGAATGFGLASKKFREALFGEQDEKGNFIKGGLVDTVKNFFTAELLNPVKIFFEKQVFATKKWFFKRVLDPIVDSIVPYKVFMKAIGRNVKNMFIKTAETITGEIKSVFSPILGPLGKLMNFAYRTIHKSIFSLSEGIASLGRTMIGTGVSAITMPANLIRRFGSKEMKAEIEAARKENRKRRRERDKNDKSKEEMEDRVSDLQAEIDELRGNGYKATDAQLEAKTQHYLEQKKIQEEIAKASAETAKNTAVMVKQMKEDNKGEGPEVVPPVIPAVAETESGTSGGATVVPSWFKFNREGIKGSTGIRQRGFLEKFDEGAHTAEALGANVVEVRHDSTSQGDNEDQISGRNRRELSAEGIREERKEQGFRERLLALLGGIGKGTDGQKEASDGILDFLKKMLPTIMNGLAGLAGLAGLLKNFIGNGGSLSDGTYHQDRLVEDMVKPLLRRLTKSFLTPIRNRIGKIIEKNHEVIEDFAKNAKRSVLTLKDEAVELAKKKWSKTSGARAAVAKGVQYAGLAARIGKNIAFGNNITGTRNILGRGVDRAKEIGDAVYGIGDLVPGRQIHAVNVNGMKTAAGDYLSGKFGGVIDAKNAIGGKITKAKNTAGQYVEKADKQVANASKWVDKKVTTGGKYVSKTIAAGKEKALEKTDNFIQKNIVWAEDAKLYKQFKESAGVVIKSIKDKLSRFKIDGSKIISRIKGIFSAVSPEKFKTVAGKFSKMLAGKTAKTAAGIATGGGLTAAFAIYDAYSGASDASQLFHIDPERVTAGMRTTAAVFSLIMGLPGIWVLDIAMEVAYTLSGGAIDIKQELLTMIYEALSGTDDVDLAALKDESNANYKDWQYKKWAEKPENKGKSKDEFEKLIAEGQIDTASLGSYDEYNKERDEQMPSAPVRWARQYGVGKFLFGDNDENDNFKNGMFARLGNLFTGNLDEKYANQLKEAEERWRANGGEGNFEDTDEYKKLIAERDSNTSIVSPIKEAASQLYTSVSDTLSNEVAFAGKVASYIGELGNAAKTIITHKISVQEAANINAALVPRHDDPLFEYKSPIFSAYQMFGPVFYGLIYIRDGLMKFIDPVIKWGQENAAAFSSNTTFSTLDEMDNAIYEGNFDGYRSIDLSAKNDTFVESVGSVIRHVVYPIGFVPLLLTTAIRNVKEMVWSYVSDLDGADEFANIDFKGYIMKGDLDGIWNLESPTKGNEVSPGAILGNGLFYICKAPTVVLTGISWALHKIYEGANDAVESLSSASGEFGKINFDAEVEVGDFKGIFAKNNPFTDKDDIGSMLGNFAFGVAQLGAAVVAAIKHPIGALGNLVTGVLDGEKNGGNLGQKFTTANDVINREKELYEQKKKNESGGSGYGYHHGHSHSSGGRGYTQDDPRWGSKNLVGNESIADAGCGPTAFASALTNMGAEMTPDQASSMVDSSVMPADGSGGVTTEYFDKAAKNVGGKFVRIDPNDKKELITALSSGQSVIAGGKSSSDGRGNSFTKNGHYTVLDGLSYKNGKFYTGEADPLGRNDGLSFDLNKVVSDVKSGGPSMMGIIVPKNAKAGSGSTYFDTNKQTSGRGNIESGLQEGINQWLGKTMDNGPVGCVEAVVKIGEHYSPFLKNENANGVRGVDKLVADALSANIPIVDYSRNNLSPGDVTVFDKSPTPLPPGQTDGNHNNHVGIYTGMQNGEPWGVDNSTNNLKVVTRKVERDWQNVAHIIKTGDPNAKGIAGASGGANGAGAKNNDDWGSFIGKLGIIAKDFAWATLNGKEYTGSDLSGTNNNGGANGGGVSATVTGENAKDIWNYLTKSLNYASEDAAAIMGNFAVESGYNPGNLQNSYESTLGSDEEYTRKTDAGENDFINDKGGYGLAQWTDPSRKEKLLKFARQRGKSIGDLGMQLEFFDYESKKSYAGAITALKAAQGIDEKTAVWEENYEGAGVKNMPKRQSEARAAYNQFAGSGGRGKARRKKGKPRSYSMGAGNKVINNSNYILSKWNNKLAERIAKLYRDDPDADAHWADWRKKYYYGDALAYGPRTKEEAADIAKGREYFVNGKYISPFQDASDRTRRALDSGYGPITMQTTERIGGLASKYEMKFDGFGNVIGYDGPDYNRIDGTEDDLVKYSKQAKQMEIWMAKNTKNGKRTSGGAEAKVATTKTETATTIDTATTSSTKETKPKKKKRTILERMFGLNKDSDNSATSVVKRDKRRGIFGSLFSRTSDTPNKRREMNKDESDLRARIGKLIGEATNKAEASDANTIENIVKNYKLEFDPLGNVKMEGFEVPADILITEEDLKDEKAKYHKQGEQIRLYAKTHKPVEDKYKLSASFDVAKIPEMVEKHGLKFDGMGNLIGFTGDKDLIITESDIDKIKYAKQAKQIDEFIKNQPKANKSVNEQYGKSKSTTEVAKAEQKQTSATTASKSSSSVTSSSKNANNVVEASYNSSGSAADRYAATAINDKTMSDLINAINRLDVHAELGQVCSLLETISKGNGMGSASNKTVIRTGGPTADEIRAQRQFESQQKEFMKKSTPPMGGGKDASVKRGASGNNSYTSIHSKNLEIARGGKFAV